jgi:autophagy-related protein 5
VLYDLFGSNSKGEHPKLPWHIVVHFQGFPSQKLLPCENEKAVEIHYMHSLKQATYLRIGTTKTIMSLPEAQQTRIWESVKQSESSSFVPKKSAISY